MWVYDYKNRLLTCFIIRVYLADSNHGLFLPDSNIRAWGGDVCHCVPVFMTTISRYIHSNTCVRIMTGIRFDHHCFNFSPIWIYPSCTLLILHVDWIVPKKKIDVRIKARNRTRQNHIVWSSGEYTTACSRSRETQLAIFNNWIFLRYSCKET